MLVIRPSPYFGTQHVTFTPKVLRVRERVLIRFPSIVFILGVTFEYFKEFGGVS
jgi:hypothetical protein